MARQRASSEGVWQLCVSFRFFRDSFLTRAQWIRPVDPFTLCIDAGQPSISQSHPTSNATNIESRVRRLDWRVCLRKFLLVCDV
jgi:hypothetical protein